MSTLRALVVALAFASVATPAIAGAAPPPAAAPAPDPATDPAGAWTHFLAHGEFAEAWTAYDVLPELGYRWDNIDVEACRKQASALQAALRKAPVGLALHRAAMLCAEATGDDAGAERAMLAFAGLAKHALQATSDSVHAAPIRVLRQHDAYAMVGALGMVFRYEWFDQVVAARTFPIAMAVWDPERKVEKVLRFDWIDVAQRLVRDPNTQYPFQRDEIAQAQIRANARSQDVGALDHLAWVDARQLDDAQALDKLRLGVAAGGVQSAQAWLARCERDKAPARCGEGFVDAVLPLAEKQHALPLALLAYAYGEGIGVPRDASISTRLLEAADQRWSKRGASAWYARTWSDFHQDKPLPASLVARLERAAASGSDDARLALLEDRLQRDAKAPLTDADIAFLSSRAMNGAGQGLAWLASIAKERKQDDDAARYERLAAEAGDAYMQSELAWRLLHGDGKRDAAEGERWLVESAHGGNHWSARQLSRRAAADAQMPAAERWLLQPLRAGSVDAALAVAALFEAQAPGTTGDAKRAVEIYRELADTHAEARRRLAMLASLGKGMSQDVALAKTLLLQDAEKNDGASQAQLGLALLNGRLGAVDEAEGVRWVERALAAGEEGAASDYGYWLYYRKGTSASRAQALDVWRKASERGDSTADNNLAWTLCTSPFDDVRNPRAGLAIVEKMGATVDMPVSLLDTVAACHAANGHFAEAKRAQAEAVAQIDAMRARRAQARAQVAQSKAPAQSAAAKLVAKAKTEANGSSVAATEADAAEAAEAEDYRARLALYADGKAYRESADRHE